MTTKDEKLFFRYFSCKKNYEKDFNKDLIQRFANIYEFCNGVLNKFILLLRKGIYPYEYIDSWQRFDKTSLPDKEAFYSNLNMKDITDVTDVTYYRLQMSHITDITDGYRHGKKVFKKFKLKHLSSFVRAK